MCGIVGAVGSIDDLDTETMMAAIGHRGPDGAGEHREVAGDSGEVWLGHRRLAIIDLSPTGLQPMRTTDGRTTIVFNGEIYNFRELRSELLREGVAFRGTSDTEVLLALYAREGTSMLKRIRGMFAFAIWDASLRRLFLARDRMGEKPLYYVHDGRRFAFSSEVRALLAGGAAERQLDADGLDAYLVFGSVTGPHTLVRGVRSLGAGELLVLEAGRIETRRYFDVREIRSGSPVPYREAVEQTRSRLHEALRRVMVADVPVAVLLSGGIDSSSNVAVLSELGHKNLHTFSVTFGAERDSSFDEATYSNLVARKFGTEHERVDVTFETARSLVQAAVASMDQPSHDGVNTYLVCEAIRRKGVKVAVSGQGADELFLGYSQRRHFQLLLGLGSAVPENWKEGFRRLAAGVPLPPDTSYEKLAQVLFTPALAGAYLAQHSIFSRAAIERLRGKARPSPSRFVEDPGGGTALDRLSRLELTHYLRNTLLRDGDQMSMAHSLELRAPFVDSDLVEYVVGTHPAHRVDPKRNKPLLLDAVGPALPREVWDRPKRGFGIPYDRWIREGLRLGADPGEESGLDEREVSAVRERFNRGANWARYWTLHVLGAWVRQHRMRPDYL